MGCDIHITIETRTSEGWRQIATDNYIPLAKRGVEGPEFSPKALYLPPHIPSPHPSVVSLLGDRDYQFFGALAGVRCTSPHPLPREGIGTPGLPENADILTRTSAAHWEGDAHSHGHTPLYQALLLKGLSFQDCERDYPAALAKIQLTADPFSEYVGFLRKAKSSILPFIDTFADPDDFRTFQEAFRLIYWFDN